MTAPPKIATCRRGFSCRSQSETGAFVFDELALSGHRASGVEPLDPTVSASDGEETVAWLDAIFRAAIEK